MPRLVHLSRREADIVISLERPARGPVVVTKLTDYVLRLYASKAYLASHAAIRTREDLRGHTFISYVDDLLFSKELQYLDELLQARFVRAAQHQHPRRSIRPRRPAPASRCCRPSSPSATSRCRRCCRHEAHFTRTFWMSVPAETKHLARMKAVWSFLRETVVAQRGVLQGPG